MPSVSKKQQQFFGVVTAMQKGKADAAGKAGKAAKTMTKGQVADFASTTRTGLPKTAKRGKRGG
jgi:hypothetical protein